jgi:transcription termination/antitermination protein NusA
MNSELQTILNYMEKERGIDREVLITAVEFALQSAARKSTDVADEVRVEVDRKSYDIRVFANLEVVEGEAYEGQVSLANAKKVKPSAKVGDHVEMQITPRNFGRIAAQTAKQAIIQKIKQAEREHVFDDYKDRVGQIASGTVRQFNRSDIIIDLGRGEAVIPARERVPTEEYQVGDRIRGYIVSVQSGASGPGIIISRSHPEFVKCLFKLEVSEIADGVVEIMGIAREPGYRTKIAVVSHDEKVDPVGACVGMRGIRVKNIVRELCGEKIDIIRWHSDPKTYVSNALSPAKLSKVSVDPDNPNLIHVIVDADQVSLAIGKRGQNVRLTARLVGLRIDIQRDESDISFEEKVARAVDSLASVEGIGRENAEKLVKAGFLTMEGILAAEVKDLEEMAGLDAETAKAVYEVAASMQPEPEEPKA